MKNKTIYLVGFTFIVLAIILGAFGAHALKTRITAEKLISFETGVKYLMYHAFGLIALAIISELYQLQFKIAIRLIYFGVLFFSGSIFLLSIQEILGVNFKFLGPITPIGGLLLILAWFIVIFKIIKFKKA